ncbi:MAG: cobyric acid synthase [Alphaproteobacteria bacterium]
MFQGTGSDVGKSLLVAGLARAYARRGLKVRPFKPQNMSNNAAVTVDGGEIGRAQALQALAAGIEPITDMNPVLLKPQTLVGAQVVVQGRVVGNADARAYHDLKPTLMPRVLESFERLGAAADLVLVEGAGSAAEVNLRSHDIANMGFAVAAGVPVVLVGDIDRGGVIASLVGCWTLLPASERALLAGYVINKLRGDVSLFDDGLTVIGERTGLPSLGVVPWFDGASRLPAEDSMALTRPAAPGGGAIRIAVPMLPRIANFDDLDPLRLEPDVALTMVSRGQPLPGDADCVLLPGSKATLADLAALREEGWDIDIAAHVRRGGWVVGLCGGYQMLGHTVADPDGIEGAAGAAAGLGLLDVNTTLQPSKQLRQVAGAAWGEAITGYEMHMGATDGPDRVRSFVTLDDGREDGAVSTDGRVMGGYVHGLFAADGFRRAFLARLAGRPVPGIAYGADLDVTLDALADHLERHMELDRLLDIARRQRCAA